MDPRHYPAAALIALVVVLASVALGGGGGGLMMMGGRRDLAEGGYAGTPVADTDPRVTYADWICDDSFDFLSRKLSYVPKERIPMVVFASHQHFEQTNIVPFFIPEGVAGFTEFLKGRVALPFNGSYADFRRVIRHELVHVFQSRKGAHMKRLHPGGHFWNSPFWFTEPVTAMFWLRGSPDRLDIMA